MPTTTFHNLPEEKRERISQAALDVFNKKGYDETSIADIVKAAGIPRGSFYQYFESKFDVFYMLLKEAQKKKLEYLGPLIEKRKDEPFFDILMDVFSLALRYLRDYPEYALLGRHMYHAGAEEVMKVVERLDEEGIKSPLYFLKRDQEKGHIRKDIDIRVLSRMIYSLSGPELLEAFHRGAGDEELHHLVKSHLDILKKGAAS